MRALKPLAANGTGRASPSASGLMADFTASVSQAQTLRRARQEVTAAHREAALSIKARSDFLANMNHELRTPLNAIIGFATMLREADNYSLTDEKRSEYAQYILQSADLLLGHINLLLEAAALDGGEVHMASARINLKEALGDALKRTRIIAGAAGVTIEDRTPETAPMVWGDAQYVGPAIDHVLRTAVRSSQEGGRILVRAIVNEDGEGEIAVRDKGKGFSDEALGAINGSFSTIHRGLEKSFAASGIELAVAKAFIEMQGGAVMIRSRQDEGALVRLILPIAQADQTAQPVQQAADGAGGDIAYAPGKAGAA